MRDGRRQRLGLATGTEDPATSNDGYLDRILSDQEAAGQSNILNLAEDANVNVRDQRYLNDAYQYYLGGGTGNFADEVAIDTPATTDLGEITADGGGTGQATSGVDLGNNLGFNAGVTPGPSGFIGLDPDMDIAPTDITDYGTYDQPELGGVDGMSGGQATPGAEFADQNPYGGDGTMNDLGADNFNDDVVDVDAVKDAIAKAEFTNKNIYGGTGSLDDLGADSFVENEDTTTDFSPPNIGEISGPATMTVDELAASDANQGLDAFDPNAVSQAFTAGKQAIADGISTVAEVGQSIANTIGGIYNGVDQTVSVFGKEINVPSTLAGIALNQVVGAPISLAFGALKAIGGMLPQESLENSTARNIVAELSSKNDYGFNVTVGNLNTDPFGRSPTAAFSDYEQTLKDDFLGINQTGFQSTKMREAKQKFAKDYFNAKAEKAGGVEVNDGTVVGPGEMPVTQDEINAFNEPTQEEKDAATEISNAASVSLGEARYGDGGPGISTPTNEFSDEEFMVGDTSIAAPATGNTASDSFFDAADNAATSSPSLTQAQSTANIDAARSGGSGSSGTLTQAQSTANIDAARGGEGGGGGGNKIVCTMMNDSYGFGSFRNKIWLKHSRDMAPEYQIGYHKIFLPLVKLSKTNKVLKKILEHIAIHRTIDIRQEARGKTHLLGRVYRKILEPVCYLVGKYAK